MKRRSNTIGGGDAPPRLDASAYRGGSKAAAAAAAAVGAAATASSTGSGGSGSGSSKRGDGFARKASLSEGLKLSKPISQAARKPSSPLSLQLNGVKDRAGRVSGCVHYSTLPAQPHIDTRTHSRTHTHLTLANRLPPLRHSLILCLARSTLVARPLVLVPQEACARSSSDGTCTRPLDASVPTF